MKNNLNINKLIVTVIFLNAVQVCAIIGIIFYNYYDKNELLNKYTYFSVYVFVFLILLAIVVNSFIAVRHIYFRYNIDHQYTLFQDTLAQMESLNNTLRAQRHDFINHLQVVYSLMEMDEYSEAKAYIEKIYVDIQKVNQVLKTSIPAVNALLQAKALFCEKKGIRMEIRISSQLKELKVPAWEFCRFLGNIIDNSIYALDGMESEGRITIALSEDIKNYYFSIQNNGPAIPEDLRDRIFEAGFTTKGDKGEGMGLAICKTVVEEHGGQIKVASTGEETVFEGFIPR